MAVIGEGPPRPPAVSGVLGLPGARLAYQVSGGGPAVVLVHGFGLDMRMWTSRRGTWSHGGGSCATTAA